MSRLGRASEPDGSPGAGQAFVRLWTAATLTNFGSMVTRIALPFLAITVLDASPAELAALTAAGPLPGMFQMMAVVFMLFAIDELGFGIAVIGMIAAVGAASSFVGATLVGRVTRALQPGYTMILGGVILAASTLVIPLVPSAGLLGIAMLVAHQLGDGGDVLYEVNAMSLRQAITPNALLGRVNGGFEFAEASAMLLGTALGGVLGEVLGLRPTLFTAAGIAFLSPLVLLASPVQSVHLGDLTPDVPPASGA